MNFDIWSGLATRSKVDAMYREGSWILQAHRANIEKFLAETYTETIGGFVGPVPDTCRSLYPSGSAQLGGRRSIRMNSYNVRSRWRRL